MKQLFFVGIAIASLSGSHAPAEPMTLFIDTLDNAVYKSVQSHFQSRPEWTDRLMIGAKVAGQSFDDILQESGQTVYVHTADTADAARLSSALQSLGELTERATYMLFLETADDHNWVSDIDIPDNVKLTLAVREFDQQTVAQAYDDFDIAYDGSALRYRIADAAQAAIAQMSEELGKDAPFALKAWSSGISALTVFDPLAVSSGADPQQRADFILRALGQDDIKQASPPAENGVAVWAQLDDQVTNDMLVISHVVAATQCTKDRKWNSMVNAGISFQSFGQ
ncbi:MAG: hypothetical protein OXH79_01990 [Boseongicola sp.]|nr:hypothetical protein [Boseongicola sp.]